MPGLNPKYPPFTDDWHKRVGLVMVSLINSVSLAAVICLLIHIARNLWKRPRRLRPLAIFFIMTLVCDLFQALSSAMDGRWADLGMIVEDNYCIAQGALEQFGEVGVSTSTLILTWATLFKIIFEHDDFDGHKEALLISLGLVFFNFLFLILLVTIPLAKYGRRYYGNTGPWCWISDDFPRERESLEYRWFWATGVSAIVVYFAALLHAYGFLVGRATATGIWLGFRRRVGGRVLRFVIFERQANSGDTNLRASGFQLWTQHRGEEKVVFGAVVVDDVLPLTVIGLDEQDVAQENARVERERKARREAKIMLLYPIAYVIVILPISVVRIRYFDGHTTTTAATILAGCFFGCSGLFNTLLYLFTGRFTFDLGPDPHSEQPSTDTDSGDRGSIVSMRQRRNGHAEDGPLGPVGVSPYQLTVPELRERNRSEGSSVIPHDTVKES